jgi:hypothetical protein
MVNPKRLPRILFVVAVAVLIQAITGAQSPPTFSVARIMPVDKTMPGEIIELQVEGLGGASPPTMLPPGDFAVEVSQDGVRQQVGARIVSPMMSRERKSDGTFGEMKPFQRVSFVVPHGLHPGTAEVVLSYRGKQGNPMSLTIVDRPVRPMILGPAVMTLSPTSLPLRPAAVHMNDMGWRFERDSKVQIRIEPLTDPDDPGAAILVRFKQGDKYYDAQARVLHESQRVERNDKRTAFLPARDVLEVEIPAALTMGPADMEVKLRINGAESDPALVKVQITDTTRSAEAPSVNAPRLLAVIPQKIGAGQALMLSVDYLRTLNPDPSQTLVSIEQGTARYFVKPEQNSALRMPNKTPDAPVALTVRPTRELIGAVQVRVFNSLKGEQGGASAPIPIEIVDAALPPHILSVKESTDADLARLREMYDIQRAAGGRFGAYDPKSRYLTIRGEGIDPNPRFVRIALEQNGESVTLGLSDVSYSSPELLIVRLPLAATAGQLKLSIANLGAEGLSVPATMTFDLSTSH